MGERVHRYVTDPWFTVLGVILLHARLPTLILFVITALLVKGCMSAVKATLEMNPPEPYRG